MPGRVRRVSPRNTRMWRPAAGGGGRCLVVLGATHGRTSHLLHFRTDNNLFGTCYSRPFPDWISSPLLALSSGSSLTSTPFLLNLCVELRRIKSRLHKGLDSGFLPLRLSRSLLSLRIPATPAFCPLQRSRFSHLSLPPPTPTLAHTCPLPPLTATRGA